MLETIVACAIMAVVLVLAGRSALKFLARKKEPCEGQDGKTSLCRSCSVVRDRERIDAQ